MIGVILFGAFIVMLLAAVPIGVALGLAGTLAIVLAGQSILAVPTNVYAGIAKYPLIAIPMFVLVGSVFDRTGVALRLVRFATALVGAGRGALTGLASNDISAWAASPQSASISAKIDATKSAGISEGVPPPKNTVSTLRPGISP